VAVAASTLIAAASFSPLRRRVQRIVDRRFNRARYDADVTLAAFAAHLKDAVDLDAVQFELTSVVQQTLERAHVSVWLSQRAPAHNEPPDMVIETLRSLLRLDYPRYEVILIDDNTDSLSATPSAIPSITSSPSLTPTSTASPAAP